MSAFLEETVLSVHHWTDRLFSFTTTRNQALRFSNGHFTMIGLRLESGKPLLRAYSIVSANYEEHLEFFSIKVQDGPLTSRLQHIKVGDKIVVGGWVTDNQQIGNPSGVLRAYDAITGQFAWAWDMGNPGYQGLPDEGGEYTRGTPNVWSNTAYDPVLNLILTQFDANVWLLEIGVVVVEMLCAMLTKVGTRMASWSLASSLAKESLEFPGKIFLTH